SNPFRRLELASVAALVNFCGGSVSGGNVAIVSSLFVILTLGGSGLLVYLGRTQGLFRRDDPRDP
ncbi:MAG: hypothetical protein ACREM8_11925, partial [Vulcanimicrobiaceae bacterium]